MSVEKIVKQVNQIDKDFANWREEKGEQIRELQDRLLGVEQGGCPSPPQHFSNVKPLSSHITSSNEVNAFLEKKIKSAGVTLPIDNILPNINNSTTVSSPATNPAQQLPGVVSGAQQRVFLREFLPSIPATSSSFSYTRETAFTNNAAAQNGEGSLKAETHITFEEVVEQIPTHAHWLKTSRQVMADNPVLIDFKMQRLRYGLDLKIENDMINGDGLNGNMNGLLKAGNFTVFTPTIGDSAVDSIRKGMLMLENSDFSPGLIIMNYADMAAIELLKDSNGEYLVGKPINGGLPTLWGTPLHGSKAVTAGEFIVLDTEQAVSVHPREEALVEFSSSDNDNFTKNLVTILAEARIGFAVHLPAGVISGLLT